MIEYKGYRGRYTFDHQARKAHGQVQMVRGVISFSGATVEELESDMRRAVDGYLLTCRQMGVEPSPPRLPGPEPALEGAAGLEPPSPEG